MCETMFFFSAQVCVNPWTVLPQADLRMYLFLGGKGMFLCFYVKNCACGHGLNQFEDGYYTCNTVSSCQLRRSVSPRFGEF